MAAVEEITGPALGQLMINRFVDWVNNSPHYKKMFRVDLSEDAGEIIKAALMELQVYRPYYWNIWWLKNHMRFKNLKVTQVERRTLDLLMYEFLARYSRGKFNEKKASAARARSRKNKSTKEK